MGVNASGPDFFRPFRQPFYHFLLKFGRFDHLRVEIGLWHRKFQHICCLDVRHLLKGTHQFRQVIKLGKPGLGPVAAALRGQFDGGDSFTEVARPVVEVDQSHLLSTILLEMGVPVAKIVPRPPVSSSR